MMGIVKYKLDEFGEEYWSSKPTLNVSNLIIGQMYIDIGSKVEVKCKTNGNYAKVEFHKRGWSASSYFKCEALIHSQDGTPKFKIHGDWSKEFILEDLETKEKEVIWTKSPYHKMVDHMYGFTPFAVQLNYFPKRL
jgi:hypothetical protein